MMVWRWENVHLQKWRLLLMNVSFQQSRIPRREDFVITRKFCSFCFCFFFFFQIIPHLFVPMHLALVAALFLLFLVFIQLQYKLESRVVSTKLGRPIICIQWKLKGHLEIYDPSTTLSYIYMRFWYKYCFDN